MRNPALSRWWIAPAGLALGAGLYLLFFHGLADRGLWSSHEARAAQNAQGILDGGGWVLPRLYDQSPELQKPPLYYWLVAGLALLRGGPVDAGAVRLPAALAALGTVCLLLVLGWRRGRPRAGLLAAVVLATALHFTWLARVGRIDMPLTLAVTAALAGYYLGQRCRAERHGRGAWAWFLLGYLAAAAAVLLKGPIGLILPALVAGLHLVVTGEFGRERRQGRSPGRHLLRLGHELGLAWGLALVAGLTVPWFVWVNRQTGGELFRVFFWYHNVERGFGGSEKLAAHPWWFYGPRFAFDFLPWSPFVFAGVWFGWKRPEVRRDPEACFGLVWLAGMVGLLSLMRFKRADYLLPAYPGAALFLGALAEGWLFRQKSEGKSQKAEEIRQTSFAPGYCLLTSAFCLLTGLGWAAYLAYALPGEEEGRGYGGFAREVRRRCPPPLPVLLFRTKPHALTFHLGRPVGTLLEWENLDWWAGRPGCYYIVMPAALAGEWPRHLKSGGLVEVLRSTDLAGGRRERALVLLHTRPGAGPRTENPARHVRASRAAADCRPALDRLAGGP